MPTNTLFEKNLKQYLKKNNILMCFFQHFYSFGTIIAMIEF